MIADEFKFVTEWIPGSRMIADSLSRLCVVPADRSHAMTNREMVLADLEVVFKKEEKGPNEDIAYFNMFDEEEIEIVDYVEFGIMDEEEVEEALGGLEDESNMGVKTTKKMDKLNPANQAFHPNEDGLRGKLAIDIPTYTTTERHLLEACTKVRFFLQDPNVRLSDKLRPFVQRMAKSCKIVDGILLKVQNRGIREIPESFQQIKHILTECHDGCGHGSVTATLARVTARYWIPAVEKVVSRHVARCKSCQQFAKAFPLYSPNYSVQTYDIFKHWAIDFVGPFPPDPEGNKYAVVAIEYLSRWAEAVPTRTATAMDAANFIYNQIITRYGIPMSIQSDNGPHFSNQIIENLVRLLTIKHRFSTPYYPQANGRVERLIGTIKPMIVKSVSEVDKDGDTVNWTPALYSTLYVYRATKHSITKVSPAMLVYGEDLVLPFQYSEKPPVNSIQHKEQILSRLQALRQYIPGLRNSHVRFAETREGKKILIRPMAYKVGESVWLRHTALDKPGISPSPFAPRWVGPYEIHQILSKGAYVLKTNKGKYLRKPVNWSRLRRYIENDAEVL
jgi:hypothetical protein